MTTLPLENLGCRVLSQGLINNILSEALPYLEHTFREAKS